MKKIYEKTCLNCGKNFTAINGRTIYCSTYCRTYFNKKKRHKLLPKTKICMRCGSEFEVLQNYMAKLCRNCRKYRIRAVPSDNFDYENRLAELEHILHIKKWFYEYLQKTTAEKAIEIISEITSRSTENIIKILGGI